MTVSRRLTRLQGDFWDDSEGSMDASTGLRGISDGLMACQGVFSGLSMGFRRV